VAPENLATVPSSRGSSRPLAGADISRDKQHECHFGVPQFNQVGENIMRSPPNNPELLDTLAQAVEDIFNQHAANNIDRMDVLAKLAGYTLFWSQLPDREAALNEFARMTRGNLERFELLKPDPSGQH
jgi:hypothetical protein